MADEPRKQTVIAELESARTQLGGCITALRHNVNVGARLKSGVARNPVAWFAGAAVLGLVLSQIPPSRRKVVVRGPAVRTAPAEKAGKAAMALTTLKFALDFAKPAVVRWIKKQVSKRTTPRPAAR